MSNALGDRGPGRASSSDNHWSSHALASILLLVAGFEAWLNESTARLEYRSPGLRVLANASIEEKYQEIPKRVSQRSPAVSPDLSLVLAIRDEIAHFLPMTVKGVVPGWLTDLQARGLFITSPEQGVDYDFGVKLCSYALAYWSWETVSQAVADFLDALDDKAKLPIRNRVSFEGFRSVCSPSRLAEYDAARSSSGGTHKDI